MKRVITTVGTSLFENYLKDHSDIEGNYNHLKEAFHQEWENSYQRIERIRKLVTAWSVGNSMASAEINSIIKLQQQLQEDLEIYLLASDSVVSRLAAEIIAETIKQETGVIVYFSPRKDVIKGLQVENRKEFEREGLVNLINRLYELWGNYSKNIIINITGGYKGVIPYLTIMGQVNGIPICYIFENTSELIWIPQAPLDINLGIFEKYSHIFKELEDVIIDDWESFKRKHGIGQEFQSCIWEEGGMISLNAVGRLFWERYKNLNFFVVYMPVGSKYFAEEPTRKHELEKAIQELYRRLKLSLDNFTKPLTSIEMDNDLRKVDIKDTMIYKHSNPHIRIQYTLTETKALKIFNYYYKHENEQYEKSMRDEYEILKTKDFTPIPFKIKEV